jgi:hypothetical protein
MARFAALARRIGPLCALLALTGCSDDGDANPPADGPTVTDAGPADAPAVDRSADLASDAVRLIDAAAADQASDQTADLPAEMWLNNYGGVCPGENQGSLGPLETEGGHWVATRLTPPAYPFTVTKVRYALAEQASEDCVTTFAHKVAVWVGTASMPVATPPWVTIDVEESAGVDAGVSALDGGVTDATSPLVRDPRELTLDSPIALSSGEHLFIAIQLPRLGNGRRLCVTMCDGSLISDRNFWSNADAPPFNNWATLGSFQINANLVALAWGSFD